MNFFSENSLTCFTFCNSYEPFSTPANKPTEDRFLEPDEELAAAEFGEKRFDEEFPPPTAAAVLFRRTDCGNGDEPGEKRVIRKEGKEKTEQGRKMKEKSEARRGKQTKKYSEGFFKYFLTLICCLLFSEIFTVGTYVFCTPIF